MSDLVAHRIINYGRFRAETNGDEPRFALSGRDYLRAIPLLGGVQSDHQQYERGIRFAIIERNGGKYYLPRIPTSAIINTVLWTVTSVGPVLR